MSILRNARMAFLRGEIKSLTDKLCNASCTEVETAIGCQLIDKEQQLNTLILFNDINRPTDENY